MIKDFLMKLYYCKENLKEKQQFYGPEIHIPNPSFINSSHTAFEHQKKVILLFTKFTVMY